MDPTTSSSTTKGYTDEELKNHLDAVSKVCEGIRAITYENEKEPGIQYFLRLRDAIRILQSSGFDSELLCKALQVDHIRDRKPKDYDLWEGVGQKLLKLCELSHDDFWATFTGLVIYETRPAKRFEMRAIKRLVEGRRGRFLTFKEKAQQWLNLDDFAKQVNEESLSALDSRPASLSQNQSSGFDPDLGTQSAILTRQAGQGPNELDPSVSSVPSGSDDDHRISDQTMDVAM
jgi:hypothetical protein